MSVQRSSYTGFPYPRDGDPQFVRDNAVFYILSDPHIRKILEKLKAGPVADQDLARVFGEAAHEFSALHYLEKVGLVGWTKVGAVRFYHLEKTGFDHAVGWFTNLGVLP